MAPRSLPLLRTTERSTFTECQWRWYVTYVLGLQGQRVPTWSWFGSAIHVGLRARYPVGRRRGSLADMLDAFDTYMGEEVRRVYTGDDIDEEEVVDATKLGRAMLKGYVQHYGRDQHWEVIHTEQPFQIDVPDWRHPARLIAVYCGTFDMVVWDQADKCYRVVDHKTRRSFPSNWTFYDSNRQGGSYLWVAPEVLRHMGIMGKNDELDGIVFNCLKKHLPDERPRNAEGLALNKDGSVSQRQPAELFHRYLSRRRPEERIRQARHVQVEAQQMNLIRRGLIQPTKNTTEDCPRCPLYEYCQLDETSSIEAEEYAKHMLRYRDPYLDHRIDMAEKDGVWVHDKRRKNAR
jgi:hypothetical protein